MLEPKTVSAQKTEEKMKEKGWVEPTSLLGQDNYVLPRTYVCS